MVSIVIVTIELKLMDETLFNKALLLFALPTFFVGLMQYITLFRILHNEDEIHAFYQKLIAARSIEGAKDVKETYSHLREHSNSTFIVILEICFTCLAILSIETIKSSTKIQPDEKFQYYAVYGFGFLLFWLIPNLFMWSRANKLEKNFSYKPESYIPNTENRNS